MTRDEQRVACIEAIGISLFGKRRMTEFGRGYYVAKATAALDAIHGHARVCPIEETEEMNEAMHNAGKGYFSFADVFRVMSAAGDLTNPPGEA